MELTQLFRKVVGNEVTTAGVSDTAGFDVPLFVSDCSRLFSRSDWRSVEKLAVDIF
jgi:hypothetical protein